MGTYRARPVVRCGTQREAIGQASNLCEADHDATKGHSRVLWTLKNTAQAATRGAYPTAVDHARYSQRLCRSAHALGQPQPPSTATLARSAPDPSTTPGHIPLPLLRRHFDSVNTPICLLCSRSQPGDHVPLRRYGSPFLS